MNVVSSIKGYKEVYITLVVVILIFVYVEYRFNNVKINGVFTICRVDSYEPSSDGSNTNYTVFLNGKTYKVTSGIGSNKMVGKFYFVKALTRDPAYEIIIYENKEVPECINKDSLPKEGWDKIPNCK